MSLYLLNAKQIFLNILVHLMQKTFVVSVVQLNALAVLKQFVLTGLNMIKSEQIA